MRKDIVKNGCSGKCCEKFTFQFTLEQIDRLIELKEKGEENKEVRNRMGEFVRIEKHQMDELKQVRDMLIYLGASDINPKTGISFNDEMIKAGIKTEEFVQEKFPTSIVKEGKVHVHTFTCKHFDKENKICTIYENRPNMCRSYCCHIDERYEGCTNVKP